MIFVSSWDDGHPLDERLGDLLGAHGFRGTFFVPIRNREGMPVLGCGGLKRLAGAHEIGSHTHDHAYLTELPLDVAQQQILHGKCELEARLGRPVTGFCYPGGRFNSRVVSLVRGAGFAYARTVENLITHHVRDRYRVPTTLQFYPHSRLTLGRNYLRYGHKKDKAWLLLALSTRRSLSDHLRFAAKYANREDGVLHIWGHSWELERYQLWSALRSFLKEMVALAPTCLTLDELIPFLYGEQCD